MLNLSSPNATSRSSPSPSTPSRTTMDGSRISTRYSSFVTSLLISFPLLFDLNANQVNNVTVNYPIIADPERKVAMLYGMLDQTHLDDRTSLPLTVRAVFVVDPAKKIRLIIIYPARYIPSSSSPHLLPLHLHLHSNLHSPFISLPSLYPSFPPSISVS